MYIIKLVVSLQMDRADLLKWTWNWFRFRQTDHALLIQRYFCNIIYPTECRTFGGTLGEGYMLRRNNVFF